MSWMDWLEALFEKYRWLFYPPEAPAVLVQETRGRPGAGARKPPPPPPKEPPLSPRRLFIAVESILLAVAIVIGLAAWRGLLGGWPGRGNFDPPSRVNFGDPALIEVQDGEAWLATAEELFLIGLTDPNERARKLGGKLPSRMVTAICKAGTDVWIGTNKGLARYSNGRVKRLPKKSPAGRVHVTCLERDGAGRLWVGTAANGILLKDGEEWKSYMDELPSPYIRDIAAYGARSVIICPFSAGLIKTDGRKFGRIAMPFGLQRKSVEQVESIEGTAFVAFVDGSVFIVRGADWRKANVPGFSAETGFKLRDLIVAGGRDALLLTGNGELLRLDLARGRAVPVPAAAKVTAAAASGGRIYTGQNRSLFIDAAGWHIPWTDWGQFIDLQRYQSPPADMPQDWEVPRFRQQAFKLFLVSILFACAMLVRSVRWSLTPEQDGWRIMPLRRAALGGAGIAALFLMEATGLVSTRVHAIIWLPLLIMLVLALVVHGIRIISHDWAKAQDAFWLGIVISLSLLGAWLWWGLGSLMPALLVCAAGGLFMARALRGLRQGNWHGFKFAWGIIVWMIQLFALLPPLLFAAGTWGKAALSMGSTASMVEGLPRIPERFVWSDDGLRAAFITPSGTAKALKIVDGSKRGWNVAEYPTVGGEITPRFSPDGGLVAYCFEREGETLVDIVGIDGKRRWLAKAPGKPAPGWQPWWQSDGDALLIMTIRGGSTDVWKLERIGGHAFKRDAVLIASVGKRLSWPWLARDGESLICASDDGGTPGIMRVFTKSKIAKVVEPRVAKREPLFVYSPSPAGEAVNSFLKSMLGGLKSLVQWGRRSLQGMLGYLGWKVAVPELWAKPAAKSASPADNGFDWRDYEVVRDVVEAENGEAIVCVARHRSGRDHLLYMGANGDNVRLIRSTKGHLLSVRWAGYRNRIMVVEEGRSLLAPFPVRSLLMLEVKPEAVSVKAMVPFSHWVTAPQFSPDGLRVVYAAPDQFWRIALRPSSTFSIYEVLLESVRRGLNPPGGAQVESAH